MTRRCPRPARPGVEPDPRHAQPFLVHLGAVAGAGPRDAPAEVAVVGDRDREAEQLLACEGGLDHEHVRGVARAVERVVDEVDVAGPEAVAEALEQRHHRVRDRAELERDRHRLRDRLPGRAAERGREVHRVADDRRVRGAEDRRRHLVGRRLERVGDEPPRDRHRLRAGVLAGTLDRDVLEHERLRRAVDSNRPARRNDHGRVVLVDQQRAVDGLGSERRAWAHGRRDRAVARTEARAPARRPRAPARARSAVSAPFPAGRARSGGAP